MADDPEIIGQNEIEDLLKQAKGAVPPSAADSPEAPSPNMVGPGEIESLLDNLGSGPAESAQTDTPLSAAASTTTASPISGPRSHSPHAGDDIQFLLDQAERAIASADEPAPSTEDLAPFRFKDFAGSAPSEEKATLDLLRDVELDVKIELGRTDMFLEEVLRLRRGSVVALDKLAGDPVDVYVNGRLIARGEVLVLNDNFCVRVAELITGDETE